MSSPEVAPSLETQKYVLFGLAGEAYALPLLHLQEIIASCEVTVIPDLPRDFDGVIGIRGATIPVMNLRRRFGFPEQAPTRQSRVIIFDTQPRPIGVRVDEVLRVESIASVAIGPPPELADGRELRFVTGVSPRSNGKLAIHVDMRQVLNSREKIELDGLADEIREAYRRQNASNPSEPTPGPDGGSESRRPRRKKRKTKAAKAADVPAGNSHENDRSEA